MRWYQSQTSPEVDRKETITKTVDGDGLDVKRVDRKDYILYPGGSSTDIKTEYYVRSTVLGGKVITELDENGAKKLTKVFAGNGVIAEQRVANNIGADQNSHASPTGQTIAVRVGAIHPRATLNLCVCVVALS